MNPGDFILARAEPAVAEPAAAGSFNAPISRGGPNLPKKKKARRNGGMSPGRIIPFPPSRPTPADDDPIRAAVSELASELLRPHVGDACRISLRGGDNDEPDSELVVVRLTRDFAERDLDVRDRLQQRADAESTARSLGEVRVTLEYAR